MSAEMEDLFSSELLRWRFFKALISSFSLQVVISTLVCNVITTLCFEVIWNPFTWIYYLLSGLIMPYWLLRIILPLCCYIALTRIHAHSFSVCWWIPRRRLEYISKIFQPQSLVYCIVFMIVTTSLIHHYASLVHPDLTSLTILCKKSNKPCINHQAFIILFFGLAFGFRLSCKYFLQNYGTLKLPVIHPSPLMYLKSKFSLRMIAETCSLFDITLGFVSAIIVAYFLLGGVVSHWIGPFISVTSEESYHLWAIIAALMDLRFILTLVVCLILLAYNIHCFFLIFEEIVTRRVELPLMESDGPFVSLDNQPPKLIWTLSKGLASCNDLLRLLAFRHLREVALDQTPRCHQYRSQIFSISQPGGHPRNWQSIVNPCLNLIRKFCDRLKQINCLEEKPASLQPTSIPAVLKTDVNRNQLVKESRFSLKQKWQQITDSLKQFPLFCYLLSELPDSGNRQTLAEGQTVIWAVEGLANLVATSYTDDHFGVVQRNISDILTAIIQLQLVTEKVGRGLPYRRITPGTNFGSKIQKYPHDIQLRRALRFSLRSSIYAITNTFKDSIREINLSEDVRNKLESYLNFQEG